MGLVRFGANAAEQVGGIMRAGKNVVTNSRGYKAFAGSAAGQKILTHPKTAGGISAAALTAMGGSAYLLRRRGRAKSRKSK